MAKRLRNRAAGRFITRDEMRHPDWQAKLQRAIRQLDAGEGIDLEVVLKRERAGWKPAVRNETGKAKAG